MTPTEDAAMHQQLGSLTAKVDMLIEATRRAEEKSDVSRASMHRRLDEVVERVGDVEVNISAVQKDVTEMKPVTDDVRRWKLMGMGALGVIGIAGVAFGVSFADALRRFVSFLTGH